MSIFIDDGYSWVFTIRLIVILIKSTFASNLFLFIGNLDKKSELNRF